LAPWEGSVTRHSDVVTSARGEPTPGRGKEGDNTDWANANLTRPKNEKKITRSIQLLQFDDKKLKQQ
jgi:hypothetical protein